MIEYLPLKVIDRSPQSRSIRPYFTFALRIGIDPQTGKKRAYSEIVPTGMNEVIRRSQLPQNC